MMQDIRKEFVGSYSTLKEKQDCVGEDECAGEDESSAQVQPVDPNIHGMKWMKERQCSYRDHATRFLVAAETPYRQCSEESSHQLARRLLSVWHWSSAVEPPTYPHTHINEHQLLAAREQRGG